MSPDTGAEAAELAREEGALAAAKASMSPAQLQDIIDATAALKQAQATDDSDEAKATIPRLSRADIDSGCRAGRRVKLGRR